MAHKPVVTGGVNGETPQPVRASVTPKHQKTKSQNKPPNMGGSAVLGCSRLSFILFISGAVNILLALLYLSVRPWSRVLYRRVTAWIQSFWYSAVAFVLPSTTMYFTGDNVVDPTRPAIIIANHQVDADWWYCWQFAQLYHFDGWLKIILKAELKSVPIIGWGMRQFEFIFLKRSWEQDKDYLYSHLGSFVEDSFPASILFFPEGTTINSNTMEKCQAFAKSRGRSTFKYLILPRTTGFNACLDALSKDKVGPKPIIYDLTIAYNGYSGEIPTWDMGYARNTDVHIPNVQRIFMGVTPKAVHVHVKKYDEADKAMANPEQWLDTRWKEKDELLQYYIDHERFPSGGPNQDNDGDEAPPRRHRYFGNPFNFGVLMALPTVFLLCLPLVILFFLSASPAIILASTIQFARSVVSSTLGKVTYGLAAPTKKAPSPHRPTTNGFHKTSPNHHRVGA